MAIPTVVRSTDPGAPILNELTGSGYTVMKYALTMCGWTLEYDDPQTSSVFFAITQRNSFIQDFIFAVEPK